MEKNIKLFPIYKLFSYDILFYYAISILFLTDTKGLTLSEVAISSSVYAWGAILFQIPTAIITDRIGLKNSMFLGNLFCLLWGFLFIVSPNFNIILLANVFSALGFSLKGSSETPFIYSSLKRFGRISEFTKIESRGSSLYFIAEAIACVTAGYLYNINVYLPIIFSSICSLISTILVHYMKPIENLHEAKQTIKERRDELVSGFKFILKSKRLRALFMFTCLFFGILSLAATYIKMYFDELNISSTLFGYIFAGASITAALGSLAQEKIAKKFTNQTLSTLSLMFSATFVFIGVISIITNNFAVLLITGIIIYLLQMFIRGAYRIIVKEYLSNYTTATIRTKLVSIYYLVENLGSAALLYIVSGFLDIVQIGLIYTLSGFVACICLLIVLNYMETRIGLKPEEYDKSDRIDLQ